MINPTLRKGSEGYFVMVLQSVLRDTDFYEGVIDGKFGSITESALKKFQNFFGLVPDGICGNLSWGTAYQYRVKNSYPFAPSFDTPTEEQTKKFTSSYKYEPVKATTKGQSIKILEEWEAKNIESVFIPQLEGVPLYSLEGKPYHGNVRLHKKAVPVFVEFFNRIERNGLKNYIKTFDGGFNARFRTNSDTRLSNHAFGTAIDINANWNGIGKMPSRLDQFGTVIPFVQIAKDLGIMWGGFWSGSNCDAMHFELAVFP